MSTKKNSKKPVRSAAIQQAGKLPPARSTAGPRSRNWKRRLQELAEFKKKYGHCCVSTLSKTHAGLGNWVRTQRGRRRLGRLTPEQIRILDELGFSWDGQGKQGPMDAAEWESMYKTLAAYRRENGHCGVPGREYFHLRRWINSQRVARRQGNLSKDRVRKLDALDFDWDGREEGWERMFAALVKYKKDHGHCDVPGGWPPNPDLAAWVNQQRRSNTRGTLSSRRRKRLEALGFRFRDQEAVQRSSRTPYGPMRGSRGMVVVGTIFQPIGTR